jgi:hypothetical protein
MNANIGDLAILFEGDAISGFYYNESRLWIKDTGIRAGEGDGEKLMHFPEKKWHSWVLNGPPGALRWERGSTIRQRLRRRKLKNAQTLPTPTVVEPDGQIGKLGQDIRFVDDFTRNPKS